MSELEIEANYRSLSRVKYNIDLMQQTVSAANLTEQDKLEGLQLLERLYGELVNRERILEIHLSQINITETINSFDPKIYTK